MTLCVVWFTGLPAAGKSTLADALAERLRRCAVPVERLDGDEVRSRRSRPLGFSPADRAANVAEIASLAVELAGTGAVVLVSVVAPYENLRRAARLLIEEEACYVEIHVATALEECIRRDPKGLYARAAAGEVAHFTGVSDAYEPPTRADLRFDTAASTVEAITDAIEDYLVERKVLTRAG